MKITTTLRIVTLAVALIAVALCEARVEAKQHTKVINGREVVVHSNPIPVILHRMVPPQYGRHVTEREVQSGKLPASRPAQSTKNR